MPLALSPTIALATEAELPILLGCQLETVARNRATGNTRNLGARNTCLANRDVDRCTRSMRIFVNPASPRLGGVGLTTPESLVLVENCVPSGGRGRASRLE